MKKLKLIFKNKEQKDNFFKKVKKIIIKLPKPKPQTRKVKKEAVPSPFTKSLFLDNWKSNKEAFLKIAEEKVVEFNKFYKFPYGRISIRDQKSRWGSCSSRGNLNFNYRTFLLPKQERDYIIIHELCHLKEMNHSQDFWKLVEYQCPDYKEIRKRLKKYSF